MIIKMLRALAVGLSTAGLLLSPALAAAAQPVRSPGADRALALSDVELDGEGGLRGLVVNVEGMPLSGATVVLRQHDRDLASTRTDAIGRFRLGQLRGGVYQVAVGPQQRLVRAWSAQTAPPTARDMALIVVESNVVRGQMAQCCGSPSKTMLMLGVVAAMVAVPVAIHNSHRSSAPASP